MKNQKSYDHLDAEKAFEKIQYLFIEKTQLIRYRRNVLNIITVISEKSTAYITLTGKRQVNVLEISNIRVGTSLVAKTLCSLAGGLGSIPVWESRCCMLIPYTITKTWHAKYILFFKRKKYIRVYILTTLVNIVLRVLDTAVG